MKKLMFIFISLLFIAIPGYALESIETTVTANINDAEENMEIGRVNLTSSDLEMVTENAVQLVGLRFTNLIISPKAIIVAAWLQFTVDEVTTEETNLVIQGEVTGNAGSFTTTAHDISSRSLTTATVQWNPPAWNIVGASGANQRIPDIKNIVQEIVNHSEWFSGNSMAFIISGEGKRVAVAYDGDPAKAVILHIEYTLKNTVPVSFSWLPNDLEEGVTGYRVHYGTASRMYTVVSDAGFPDPVDGRIYHTIAGVPEGETFFFAAVAYNVTNRSSYSNEIEHTVPSTIIPVSAPADMRIED